MNEILGRNPPAAIDRMKMLIRRKEVDEIRLMVAAGFDLNESMGDDLDALQFAVSYSDVEMPVLLLELGANPNNQFMGDGCLRYSALHSAVGSQRYSVVPELLAAGADPNMRAGHAQITPLHSMTTSAHKPIIWLSLARNLLEHGADPNAVSLSTVLFQNDFRVKAPFGEGIVPAVLTPLHNAILAIDAQTGEKRKEARGMLALLLEFGAHPSFGPAGAPKNYLSPIHLAAKLGAVRELEVLLSSPLANVEQKTGAGRTLMQVAKGAETKAAVLAHRSSRLLMAAIEESSGLSGPSRSSPSLI
jgi:ankyrin repeat protein